MPMGMWIDRRDSWERDGSLRDIYVFETSEADWARFLRFARETYRTEFLVDLQPRPMPDTPHEIFALRERDPVLLRVFLNHIQLNCHFFWMGDLELDLDPREIDDADDERRVTTFVDGLGQALQRPVVMTFENAPELVAYRFDP
jgi:hypothetical protein